MKKRLFAALTALTVVFAMAGCSSTPQTDSVEPQTEEQVTETEEAQPRTFSAVHPVCP